MKIRVGLVLAMALLFVATACASGGGGAAPAGSGADALAGIGGGSERPRNTTNTRAADEAIEAAAEAGDPAEARMHYEQARTSADAAIAEDPTNPLAHRLAALAALGLEEYEAAGTHFDRAGELYPVYDLEDQRLREQAWIDLYNEAIPLINTNDYEASAELLAGANAIYKGRPEAMVTLGQIYAQLGRHDEAIAALDEAVAFVNGDMMAEVDSATAADWRQTVADVPLLRAQVLAAGGRFEEAIASYEELAAADPTNLEYPKGIAALHMEMGDEAAALQVYADLLDRPGLSAQDLYAIGVGFYQGNDYERAARAFGGTAERNPRDRDALELWARSLQLDSAFTEVPPIARRWIELDPNSQNAYLILAQAANALQDQATTQEAIRNVEALQVNVDQLTFRHDPDGGGTVTGTVVNKQLNQGQQVTLLFTFYGSSGSPIGTVSETVAVGATNMSEVLQVEFESGQAVAGYGYQLTVG